jgi:hypothetical protein
VGAAVTEGYSRTSHKVLYGIRHEYFTWTCLTSNASADVHGNTTNLGTHDLALASVNARAYL